MRIEKHIESLKEVLDEIESALKDPGGLLKHQRRLAIMLSLGICELVEIYFHKLGIMKSGSRIKHTFFKKKDAKEEISNQIAISPDDVKNLDEILNIAKSVEEKRDDMFYGSPVNEEELLKDKINQFLELKNLIEKEVGGVIEK